MKGPQFVAWIFFILSFFTGVVSPTLSGLAALACGIVRKGGVPKMNMEYV
jgi:hypothetical protein